MSLIKDALRRTPFTSPKQEAAEEAGALKRSIGLFRLTTIGISATIGTGIFFILNQAVPIAGPGVVVSFVIAAAVAGLTALCYAEFASRVPSSGSSYSYAYTTLGEFPAVLVGSCLILERGVAAAAVTVGWSEYLNRVLDIVFGITIPEALSQSPESGGIINLPAMILLAMCMLLLIRGTSESMTVNAIMVVIKVCVLLMFVAVAFQAWDASNLVPFAPQGAAGIIGATGLIFFSFVGVDTISTAGDEVKSPRRTLPLAILLSLAVVCVVYIAVALTAVAAQPAARFEGQSAGLAAIMTDATGQNWPGLVLSLGAVISIFSVTIVILYAQTRVLFAMSCDGVISPVFKEVRGKGKTPVKNTVIVAVSTALLAGLVPLRALVELVSIGTLVAFLVVSLGLIVLRRTIPDTQEGFKVPFYPVTPILSALGCLWLIINLNGVTLAIFAFWVALVIVFYLGYSRRHSLLAADQIKLPGVK